MNCKIGFLLALISTGSVLYDSKTILKSPQIKQVVYAFDFDGVILDFDVMYWLRLAKEYRQHVPSLLCNGSFRRDVRAAWSSRGLYDEADNKIIGGYQTVDYLVVLNN